MRRSLRFLVVCTISLLVAGTAFLALVSAAPPAQEGPPIPDCLTGRHKSADPMTLDLGAETDVTLIMTGTCPSYNLPIDIIFLVDRSNSMTCCGGGGSDNPGLTTPGTPDNFLTPLPTDLLPVPRPTEGPGPVPTGFAPLSAERRMRGLSQLAPTPTKSDLPTRPPLVTPPDGAITPTPGGRPTVDLIPRPTDIRRGEEEARGTEYLVREVQQDINEFLDHIQPAVDEGRVRVGLVVFNDRANVYAKLDDRTTKVRSGLARIRPQGNTRLDLGLNAARRELVGRTYYGRNDRDNRKLVIVYSDGLTDKRKIRGIRDHDDIEVFSVAAGRAADRRLMRDVATEVKFALELRDRRNLAARFDEITPNQRGVTMDTLTIEDKLMVNMSLVAGSANPAPVVAPDGTMAWDFTAPTFPITITYRVRPGEAGKHKVSELARAKWTDSTTRNAEEPFPEVELEILVPPTPTFEPSATPEPTTTAMPSPTPTPGPAYLPLLLKQEEPVKPPECRPETQTVDVALVIDTSSSMLASTRPGGISKLDAAREAALVLVDMLKLSAGDQAAIVSFNSDVVVAAPLTSDRAAIEVALTGLTTGTGTRLDMGIAVGRLELLGGRHKAENTQAMVVVTDGLPTGDVTDDAVLAEARAAKQAGISVYVVGVGADVDQNLLRQVATSPETYWFAPDAEELRIIYERIAPTLPCP